MSSCVSALAQIHRPDFPPQQGTGQDRIGSPDEAAGLAAAVIAVVLQQLSDCGPS